MIDCSWKDAFGVLSFPFRSTVLQCEAQLPIHTLNYWTVSVMRVQRYQFFNWGVPEYNIAHRQSVTVLCVPFKIKCKLTHPLNGALPMPFVPVSVTRRRRHW